MTIGSGLVAMRCPCPVRTGVSRRLRAVDWIASLRSHDEVALHIAPARLFKRSSALLARLRTGDPQCPIPDLDFGLGEMADTIRETTQRFAARQDRADRRRDRRDRRIPAPSVAADGRARASRHHRRGGIWRARPRLSRACRRAGGSRARVGLGGLELWRALEPVRQPDPPLGQSRAEEANICPS